MIVHRSKYVQEVGTPTNQVPQNVKHVMQGQQVHQDPLNVKFVKQESSLQGKVLRPVALAKK
jgi:hypothetical protein